jgi:thioredoxin-related protein
MSKINQKIELIANVLIIVVAILLIGVIAQRYFFSPSTTLNQPARVQPAVGTKINLPDTEWSKQPKTLILALQKGCHFCSESAPFYQRLRESVQDKNVRLVAVLPGVQEESAAYLNELGLPNLEVKQSPLDTLQVSGTPTLILTNDKGEVTHFWVGKLSPEKEKEVLEQLTS